MGGKEIASVALLPRNDNH